MGCTLTLQTVSMEMYKFSKSDLLIRGRVTFMKKVLISSPRSRPKSWDEDMNYET